MHYVYNPMTGTVKYATYTYARFLLRYGWRNASFEQYMAWQCQQYALYPAVDLKASTSAIVESRT